MSSLTDDPWFGWAVGLAIALPIALIVLTEVHGALSRRGSPLAAPVAMLRNFALPAGALLVLFTEVWEIEREATWLRILATVFGFLVLVLALSALNVVLFKQAGTGTWRERMPSIFVDIVRLVLVVAGLAALFAWVWGADVGGLFAALGVTSIVLGFALQNAVGSIISGLLLLFEQPFRLGDWLAAEGVKGRIVEVNWRSVHIETGDGVQIIPNATLAGASFTNLSQPAGSHAATVTATFGPTDPPDRVLALLEQVAADVPVIGIEPGVAAVMTGARAFATTIAVRSPAHADDAAATFTRWLWYAARRAGLHLDGADPQWSSPEEVVAALREVAPILRLRDEDVEVVAVGVQLERWATGEHVQREGAVPDAMRFVRRGQLALRVTVPGHGLVPLDVVRPGGYLGITTLTRELMTPGAVALDEVELLCVPQDVMEQLVAAAPLLARELGQELDQRRVQYRQLLETLAPTTARPRLAAG